METYEKNTPNYIYRLKNLKLAFSVINKYPEELTFNNLDDFGELANIGKGTLLRIKEILSNGYLEEIKDFKDFKIKDNSSDLDKVIGIGKSKIDELAKLKIYTVKDLKKAVDANLKVSNTIKMGLKYYDLCKDNIPRKEIDSIKKFLKNVIDDKYFFEICGSYRRGKLISSDIDVLISTKESKKNNFINIIKLLSSNLSLNNNNPFLVDNLTEKITTKYMGFCCYKNNPIRRIDIRFVNYKYYYSALLYFTGPADFNRNMRNSAKKLDYKLSEYGLKNIKNGTCEKITSEEDIFKILNLDYVEPTKR